MPTTTEATASAAMPRSTTRLSTSIPYALISAHTTRNTAATATTRPGVGVHPNSAKNQGDARYAIVVCAKNSAHTVIQPTIHAYLGPISRRVHWYAPPEMGKSAASSAYTHTTRACRRKTTGSAHTHAGPATTTPSCTTAYRPTTGETVAKPIAMLPKTPRLRLSSWR